MTPPKDKVETTPPASWMPRAPVEHLVKSWTHLFAGFVEGRKFHDMRNHDHDFRVGDTVVLREWDAYQQAYTGREERRIISYITGKTSP